VVRTLVLVLRDEHTWFGCLTGGTIPCACGLVAGKLWGEMEIGEYHRKSTQLHLHGGLTLTAVGNLTWPLISSDLRVQIRTVILIIFVTILTTGPI
jgi:hypothetical protein